MASDSQDSYSISSRDKMHNFISLMKMSNSLCLKMLYEKRYENVGLRVGSSSRARLRSAIAVGA